MATSYGKTCENENYGGMCRIYVDLYRDLLWAVFIDKVPIPVLVRELAKFLKNARKSQRFHHQFNRLLNVHASTGTIKNTDCDISVIYSLFRNIPTTLVPPTHGWGNIPQPGDFLVTDDLERIHHGRNGLIGHAGEASITDADFTAQLSDIKDIVTRLDRHLGSTYLSHLLQIESDCHLNHYDEYIKELKRQQDAEADLRALVEDNKQAIRDVSSQFGVEVVALDTKFAALDSKFAAQGTKIAAQDTKIAAQDTKFDEVQHTLKEHEQERDKDRKRLTAVQRRQEEKSQEKQKRANELSAGQDKLKKYLLKLYRDRILQIKPNVWFSMKDNLQMVVPLEIREDLERWMALSRADRKKDKTSKAREGTKIESMRDIFFKGLKRQYEIYLLGEAGVGKSTFCHQLIDNWCKVQDTESNDDYLRELKSFPFLFFIQARDAKRSESVYEMIQTQNCPLQFRSILEKVLTSHPDNCLVLIDGLDEWQSGTRGSQQLPKVTDIEGSTILITSRQWRIEALDCDLPSSCRVLEIQGLDSDGIENLAGKAFEAFTSEKHQCSDCESLVKPFLDQMYALELDNLATIPLILLILIRSWLDGNRKLKNAHGFIYTELIESLLIHCHGKKVEKETSIGTDSKSKPWRDCSNPNILPMCFSEKGNCHEYNLLLKELARLAYDHLFSAEKENTLVFSKDDLAKQPRVQKQLQMCLKLGLLIESKHFSETKECHIAFSFPHKTLHEFFCAVYLSGEEFETGLAKFCERVTFPHEVFDVEKIVLFLSGMNLTRCKTLFDYICSIVFCRKFANEELYPDGWYMRDKVEKIEKLAEQCRAEARYSVPEGSHTGESQFVMHDMVVDKDTPELNVEQFCKLGLDIKSLVYYDTVTPFSIVESIRTMQYIQRLGIGCTAENTEKYIVCICKYLSNLQQLKSFSFSVVGSSGVLPIHVSTEIVSKLGTLPNLVSVYLERIDLSDINTCKFTSHLTSLGLRDTGSLSPGFVSGWCNQLHTIFMSGVYLSQAAVHQLRQYLMTSSSLQSLMLFLPGISTSHYHHTVFDDVFDLTSHTSLNTLMLSSIDLKSGVRIHPGHNWWWISMSNVSMSEPMWQEVIHSLPTEPLQQLNVRLVNAKSLNTQTMSYIRDTFCVTKDSVSTDSDSTDSDSTDSDRRDIYFNKKH